MRTSKPSPSGRIRTDWDRPLPLKGLARRKGEEYMCSAGSQSGKPLYLFWGRPNKGQREPQEVIRSANKYSLLICGTTKSCKGEQFGESSKS